MQFFILRHGAYDPETMRLNANGKTQIRRLAGLLKPATKGRPVRILTSTAPRALDSAMVLAEALGRLLTLEEHATLWSDNSHPQNDVAALALLRERSKGMDAVIVVTHLEYADSLPAALAKELLGKDVARTEVEKGKGRVIDTKEKTVRDIG